MGITGTLIGSVKKLPRKLFGTRNDRLLKAYQKRIPAINELESTIRGDFDERWAARCTEEGLDQAPEEEREAIRQRIRDDLNQDLRERTEKLRERVAPLVEFIESWWHSLTAAQRAEEHMREEYRKRDAKLTSAFEEAGLIREAFAVLREASRREQDHRHFDCQLIGGRVLFEGRIAEMRTGEGKTIVCHLAAFLKVLCGLKVHVITVNDYLVERDAQFAKSIFRPLGISVGYIQAMLDPGGQEGIRRDAYGCDITYGTNAEFGFDYLRDNMKTRLADQVQGRLDYVIVDEVDSILIDEARTPLIISGPTSDDVTRYPRADKVAEELVRRQAVWDRKLLTTVGKFDGDTHNIPKLGDAFGILGHREQRKGSKKPDESSESDGETVSIATLGPDFLTDDQVEAIQLYEHDILNMGPSERYRRYFIVQKERKQVGITHDGVTIAQELLDLGSLYSGSNMEWPHLIENALRAHKVYTRDVDYVVQDGTIIIVDPHTGRLMHGRQWSDGLHQAVEAKERVVVKEETQTLATITIQNFVKIYRIKAGMTGTAMTEATEFDKIYQLEVVEIPTNRPINRVDHNDKMYRSTDQKYHAIVEEIHEVRRRGRPADPFLIADVLAALQPIHQQAGKDTSRIDEAIRQFNAAELGDKKVVRFMLEVYDEAMGDLARGRPVLVGTTSVENSEKISKLLDRQFGIDHEVLNAKNHSREAEIVAKAGFTTTPTHGHDKTPVGNVTVATNMAGRGTDIKLGPDVVYATCKMPKNLPDGVTANSLYPTGITKCCIHCTEYDPATNCAHCFKPKLDPRFPALGRTVCPLNVPCGLHIIGTERHEARRIDNQLRGRSGRQGDPGSSRFSLSLQDDLLKLFMPDWMLKMMDKLGFTDGGSLEDKRLTKGIERAQRKVEERNYSTRKHLLEWDEPMDFQRKEFYRARQRILEERDLPALIFNTIDETIETTLEQFLGGNYHRTCIAEWCRNQIDLTVDEDSIRAEDFEEAKSSILKKAIDDAFDVIRTSIGEYIDPDEEPKQWDVGGLSQWAQRQYKFSISQNQLRRMQPKEIEDALLEAARKHYDSVNLDGIALYLDPNFPHRALCDWSLGKFGVKLDSDELRETPKQEIAELLETRVRDAYYEREIAYPVETCLARAFSEDSPNHAAAAETVVQWTNHKFRVEWTLENVQGRSEEEVREELLALNRSFFEGRLAEEIERNIENKSEDEAVEWAKERFGRAWNDRKYAETNGDFKAALLGQGREMLRWELSKLEQFVLLRIYDQAWKDHLLEMDHLKSAIMQRPLGGDTAHPQSQFSIEGRELFNQMWARISERVTDIIFKVRASGDGKKLAMPQQSRSMALAHGDATGAGFAVAATDQAAAMKAQGTDGKVETIRREQPKVGRNEPCPCGSGKKYKQCHGRK